MAGDPLRVSLVQGATRWHDPEGNRGYYGSLIAPLAGRSDLVVLPETFTSGFSNAAIEHAEDMQGPTVAWLRAQARALDAAVTGSVQLRVGEGVYNRLLFATPDGDVRHYDKRHLFRYADEHKRYAAGGDRIVVAWRGWKVCPLVCYDLRFPVFSRNRHSTGEGRSDNGFDYDLVLFVANWPSARAHAWRTLLRARAIENLAYCVGVNRVGIDGNGLPYQGDSAVLDFLGQAVVDLGAQEQTVTVALDAAALAAFREKFPAWMDADAFTLES